MLMQTAKEETTVPLLQGRSRPAGPNSPTLTQYQESLLDDLSPVPESGHSGPDSMRLQRLQQNNIDTALPARAQSASRNQHPARPWHRSVLERANTSRSNGDEPSWANVVPLSLLGRWAAVVECPLCKELTRTTLRHETGKGTQ